MIEPLNPLRLAAPSSAADHIGMQNRADLQILLRRSALLLRNAERTGTYGHVVFQAWPVEIAGQSRCWSLRLAERWRQLLDANICGALPDKGLFR